MKNKNTGALYALLVLSAIDDFFNVGKGEYPIHSGALLMEGDLTIQQAVKNAIKHLQKEVKQ